MYLRNSRVYIEDLRIAAKESVNIEKLYNSSVLITGATGTIGSFLVDMILQKNLDDNANIVIYAAGRSQQRLEKRFGQDKTGFLHFVEYDINLPIEFDFDVDYVIHAGGNAHPVAFNNDPVGTIIGNVNGTYNLLEYARSHGTKRLLYVSSGEVYGQGDVSLDSFEESYSGYVDPTSPRSCYPASKRATETLCASYTKQYGLETVIVRPCHTFGPVITENDSRANAQFIRNALNGEDIVLKSPGTQMRSYCYVADCVSAIITVLLSGQAGKAYNSANSKARITIAGLATVIASCVGRRVVYAAPETEEISNQTPIAKQVLSSAKIEALGWKGHFSVEEGISHTIAIIKGE